MQRKEIGSEFWDIPLINRINSLFPQKTKWFISGTAALEYVINDMLEDHIINSVALPSWCCNSMIVPFINKGISTKFYPVYLENGNLVCNYTDISADCWLLLPYFGYTSQIEIGLPKGVIIRDLTHSIFSNNIEDSDYYFGSLRKWAGFKTGGFAWKNSGWTSNYNIKPVSKKYIELRSSAMDWKKQYLEGRSNSKGYLDVFTQAESYLDSCGIEGALDKDIYSANHINVDFIKNKRRENAGFLLRYLSDYAIFKKIKDNDCPMFVPIVLDNKNRNKLRQHLINNSIYCPIHWPVSEEHLLSKNTRIVYDTSISIICDQRYSLDDMNRIVKVMSDFGLI